MRLQRLCYSFYLFVCIGLAAVTSSASEATASFNRYKLYAEMANAAYLTEQQAQAILKAQGYRLDRFSSVPGVEVNYFVATNDTLKQQIIVARGTANAENGIVSLSLKLLPDKHSKIALHQGFSQAAEGVYQAVLPTLRKDYKISTTGHSLGGAIAVILAMYLDIDHYTLGPIITFGQPKITNVGGAQAFRHLNIIRVVTSQDLVPLIPPLDLMDINNINIYWHLGKEIVLLEGNDYAVLEGMKSMMRATRVINTTLSQENLDHHMMGAYLGQLEIKAKAANLVPYETDINFLQLFGN